MSDLLAEFEKALRNHDWYYDYSDDGSVWRRGLAEADNIRRIRNELKSTGKEAEAEALWKEHCPWAEGRGKP